jgi:hypothetical protein
MKKYLIPTINIFDLQSHLSLVSQSIPKFNPLVFLHETLVMVSV